MLQLKQLTGQLKLDLSMMEVEQALQLGLSEANKLLGKQMKRADKLGARYVVIQGGDEAAAGGVLLRDMTDGSQQQIDIADALAVLGKLAAES